MLFKERPSVRILICGDGVIRYKFDELAKQFPNVLILGRVSGFVVSRLLVRAVASLIPYKNFDSMRLGIPNKFFDALSFGAPVLTCLRGDVERLVDQWSVGLNYSEGDERSLYAGMIQLLDSDELRSSQSENAIKLYESRFEFGSVYRGLAQIIERVAEG
jgi:glycosyltransferase involved in cell wall biosynthesis